MFMYTYIHENLPLVMLISMLFTNAKTATRNEQTQNKTARLSTSGSLSYLMRRPQAMPLTMLVYIHINVYIYI